MTNVAVDDDLNSVLNLTVILKANKGIPDAQKKSMNKNDFHNIAKTEPKTPVDKNKSTKEQNRGKPDAFDILILKTHNSYRKKHNVPPLKYSAKVNTPDLINQITKQNKETINKFFKFIFKADLLFFVICRSVK